MSLSFALVFFQNRITVQLNMHEGENSQLVPATRARRRISSTRWEQIKTAYASGIGLREMARNMGIPAGTVLARAKREGWTRQVESAKAVVRREDALLAVTPIEAVAMSMQRAGNATSNAWRASQSVALITSKQWTALKSSTPLIKSRNSTRL